MYFGGASVVGRNVQLSRGLHVLDFGRPLHDFKGAWLGVLTGSGAGQWARVTANANRTITIDRELEHSLDQTSQVSIVPYRGNLFFVANDLQDGGPFNLYAMAQECIVAENTAARFVGFGSIGMNPHGWWARNSI